MRRATAACLAALIIAFTPAAGNAVGHHSARTRVIALDESRQHRYYPTPSAPEVEHAALSAVHAVLARMFPVRIAHCATCSARPRASGRAAPPAASAPPLPLARPGAPTPISSSRCADRGRPDVGALIEATFGPAGPWAESVAVRESSCTPGIRNSRGCLGIFQFCGHEDIFTALCGPSPAAWLEAGCEVRAAFSLYSGSGTGPWGT